MHAQVAPAGLDVTLKSRLLLRVQYVAGGAQEDHRLVLPQAVVMEVGGVFGGVDPELVLLPQLLDGRDAVRDGGVFEAAGLGEDQHPGRCRLLGLAHLGGAV